MNRRDTSLLRPAQQAADLLTALRGALADTAAGPPTALLAHLVAQGLDQLPQPGDGHTLLRWQALAAVARHDLSLAKLYEGHTDALAVLQELGHRAVDDVPPGTTWGMWAAEPPGRRVLIEAGLPDGACRLQGVKAWCSGAADVSHGLLTAWFADGRGPQLVAVAMRQPGITLATDDWRAVGMAASGSVDVAFDGAQARLVGQPGSYLARPGFWQGGAGIAACWYGGSLALADALHRAVAGKSTADEFRLAALGRIDVALQATAALLREAAAGIDSHPAADASASALRLRQSAEGTARLVLDEVGRALGATPFCRDSRFAQAAADLPVYIRQSHADRDFAALGRHLATALETPWRL